MKSITTPFLKRASLLAISVIFMGLALSWVVYQSTAKVKTNAIDVVEQRIPILISINELVADLSEQERIIYEYYRSQNGDMFLESSQNIRQTFNMHFTAVLSQPRFQKQSQEIAAGQMQIEQLFMDFYQAMQLDTDNWDEMRDILMQVSVIRTQLLPTLKSIEQQTRQTVDEGHKATLAQMAFSHQLVIAYGISIVLIAGLVSWYIRQYMLTQAKNTRLALFSQQNPNPIISVNNLGEVLFANPACDKLLSCVGYSSDNVEALLPSNFLSLREKLSRAPEHSLVLDQELSERILQISIYWHEEIDAYDIHIKDVTEAKIAQEQVNHLAFYHQETNLPNQYKLNNDVDDTIASKQPFSIGVIAIRDFDNKVSTLGGEAITELVNELANIIASSLPSGVHFYQVADGQFALLCTKSKGQLALQKLTMVITAVAESSIATKSGEYFVELDFGYSSYPQHSDDRNNLIKGAHMALAVALNNEHENFAVYDSEFSEGIQRSNELTDNLRHALTNNELFLVYQPQLDIQENKVTGIETLVRWKHDGHIVSPVDFIPLAEQSGLIVSIGEWILTQACQFAKQLVRLGYNDIIVAVNVSPRQFSHPQFCAMVRQVLKDVALAPRNLELEITEGVFMHNEENTLSVLQQLKTMGLHLSIDDFGTGYSSLSYLKRFPIDKLKIDQSFIRECHNNDEDKAIISTIVSLGKSLGLSLIAEGVEELVHVDFLKELQCDEIQGYWFSRPVEPEALIELLIEKGGDINTQTSQGFAS
ncbi:putative bifunctional diguanylate cyclase/phosphodiesterase [Litorilituus lipolyticus]|uniref:cyclic-guanylate-specific phosphodiesterase n=1 Tax=Litorilituus lipolyticus TaxID=2491017 RepID=A0A502KPF0_9GAMM|nr:bifunctional diguanylate cyclase/phosphodiesterase [Litorilituus lipolyticus]TPH12149.1 GGDEF domain-containing protein [Litorilituus lipolyticus]